MEEVRFFAKGSIDSSTVNAENKSIMTLAAFGTKRLLDLVASFIGMYNPQIEMFARFKMKSSFHKTKRII